MAQFRSMVARYLAPPVKIHELDDGDFSIYAVDEDKQTAMMVYRAPGSALSYGAHLTMDKAKQDKAGTSGTYWWWNGDLEKPTCKPSFGVPANPPWDWHGFLTDGMWVGV